MKYRITVNFYFFLTRNNFFFHTDNHAYYVLPLFFNGELTKWKPLYVKMFFFLVNFFPFSNHKCISLNIVVRSDIQITTINFFHSIFVVFSQLFFFH